MINASLSETPSSVSPSIPPTPPVATGSTPPTSAPTPAAPVGSSVPVAAPNYIPKRMGSDHKLPLKKIIIGVVAFMLLSVGAVTAFYLSQNSSDIRQQASGGMVYGCNNYRTADTCPPACRWIPQGSVCTEPNAEPEPTSSITKSCTSNAFPTQVADSHECNDGSATPKYDCNPDLSYLNGKCVLASRCYIPPSCSKSVLKEKCDPGEYGSIQLCAQAEKSKSAVACVGSGMDLFVDPVDHSHPCTADGKTLYECNTSYKPGSKGCEVSFDKCTSQIVDIPGNTSRCEDNGAIKYQCLTGYVAVGGACVEPRPANCASEDGLYNTHVSNSTACYSTGVRDVMYACNGGFVSFNNGCVSKDTYPQCGSNDGLFSTSVSNTKACFSTSNQAVMFECQTGYVPGSTGCAPKTAQTSIPLVTCYTPPFCSSGVRKAACGSGETTSPTTCADLAASGQAAQTTSTTQVTTAPTQATAQSGNLFGATLTGDQ